MVRLSELTVEIMKEDRPILSAAKCSPWPIKIMRIFVGVPWRDGLISRGAVKTSDFFLNFGRHILEIFGAEDTIIMQRHEVPCRLSSDPKMIDFE